MTNSPSSNLNADVAFYRSYICSSSCLKKPIAQYIFFWNSSIVKVYVTCKQNGWYGSMLLYATQFGNIYFYLKVIYCKYYFLVHIALRYDETFRIWFRIRILHCTVSTLCTYCKIIWSKNSRLKLHCFIFFLSFISVLRLNRFATVFICLFYIYYPAFLNKYFPAAFLNTAHHCCLDDF